MTQLPPPPQYPPPSDRPPWAAGPPTGQPARPIRGSRVTGGIALAVVGHLLAIGAGVLALVVSSDQPGAGLSVWLTVSVLAQLTVFFACLVFGILGLVRGDRGLGLGLLVGWAVGIMILPVIGFGVCVALLNSSGVQ